MRSAPQDAHLARALPRVWGARDAWWRASRRSRGTTSCPLGRRLHERSGRRHGRGSSRSAEARGSASNRRHERRRDRRAGRSKMAATGGRRRKSTCAKIARQLGKTHRVSPPGGANQPSVLALRYASSRLPIMYMAPIGTSTLPSSIALASLMTRSIGEMLRLRCQYRPLQHRMGGSGIALRACVDERPASSELWVVHASRYWVSLSWIFCATQVCCGETAPLVRTRLRLCRGSIAGRCRYLLAPC